MMIRIKYNTLSKLKKFGELSLRYKKEYIGFLIFYKNELIDIIEWKLKSKKLDYVEFDNYQLERKIKAIKKDLKNDYNLIGTWHTHPFGNCRLSVTDKKTMIENYKEFNIKYEMIIATNKSNKTINLTIKQLTNTIAIYEKNLYYKFGIWKVEKGKIKKLPLILTF